MRYSAWAACSLSCRARHLPRVIIECNAFSFSFIVSDLFVYSRDCIAGVGELPGVGGIASVSTADPLLLHFSGLPLRVSPVLYPLLLVS